MGWSHGVHAGMEETEEYIVILLWIYTVLIMCLMSWYHKWMEEGQVTAAVGERFQDRNLCVSSLKRKCNGVCPRSLMSCIPAVGLHTVRTHPKCVYQRKTSRVSGELPQFEIKIWCQWCTLLYSSVFTDGAPHQCYMYVKLLANVIHNIS